MNTCIFALSAVVYLFLPTSLAAQQTEPAPAAQVTVELDVKLPMAIPDFERGGAQERESMNVLAEAIASRFVRAISIAAGPGLADVRYDDNRLTLSGTTPAVETASAMVKEIVSSPDRPQINVEVRFMTLDDAGIAALPAELRTAIARVHATQRPADVTRADFEIILATESIQSLTAPNLTLFDGQTATVAVLREVAGTVEKTDGIQMTVGAAVKGDFVAIDLRAKLANGFGAERKSIELDRLMVADARELVLVAAEKFKDSNGQVIEDEPLILVFVRAVPIITPIILK